MRYASISSMCGATTPLSTTASSARSPTAMLRSVSPSTPRITAGANATSPSAYVRANRRDVSGREFQMALDWRTVKRIKDTYRIPLVIKGIATAEDADIAVDHGVEWIYVSNHGGRQLDHGRGAMHVLPEIAAAVGGRAKIMVDGSFCRGTDIVKAIAAGADLVGLGRLQCWALAAGGEAGIVRMLELLEDEVQRCMGLLGVNSFAELDKSYLHAAATTNAPSVFSAFPLWRSSRTGIERHDVQITSPRLRGEVKKSARSAAHLNGLRTPTMRGMHAALNDIAIAVVI